MRVWPWQLSGCSDIYIRVDSFGREYIEKRANNYMRLHLVQHYHQLTTVIPDSSYLLWITVQTGAQESFCCSVCYNVPDYESFIETLLQHKEALIFALMSER